MLQEHDAAIGTAKGYQEENSMASGKNTRTLCHDRFCICNRAGTAKNGIKRAFTNDQIKRLVLKGKSFRDIGTNKLHLRATILSSKLGIAIFLLHLLDDYMGKVHIGYRAFPAITNHVLSKGRVSTTQDEDTALIIGRERLPRVHLRRGHHGLNTEQMTHRLVGVIPVVGAGTGGR